MASDGSQPLGWYSSSALMQPGMRRPGMGDMPSHTYADARKAQGEDGGANVAKGGDRTGTWNGPAPKGYVRTGANGTAAAPAPMVDVSDVVPADVDDAQDVLLGTGARMPLLCAILGPSSTPAEIASASAKDIRHFEVPSEASAGAKDALGADAFVSTVAADQNKLNATLAAWGRDHVDLLLVPAPAAVSDDDAADAAWKFAAEAVKAGKAKAAGLTNCDAPVLNAVARRSKAAAPHAPVAVARFATSPHDPKRMMMGLCNRVGAAPIALEPVHENEPGHAAVQCIATRAAKTGTEAIIRWQIQRGAGVAVPVGDLDGAKVGSGVFKWAMSDNEKRGIDALGK